MFIGPEEELWDRKEALERGLSSRRRTDFPMIKRSIIGGVLSVTWILFGKHCAETPLQGWSRWNSLKLEAQTVKAGPRRHESANEHVASWMHGGVYCVRFGHFFTRQRVWAWPGHSVPKRDSFGLVSV